MLTAFFHFVKMLNDVIAFFSGKAVKIPYVYDKGLMPFVIVHTFETPPHIEGCFALVYMDHLCVLYVALYLHMSESVV